MNFGWYDHTSNFPLARPSRKRKKPPLRLMVRGGGFGGETNYFIFLPFMATATMAALPLPLGAAALAVILAAGFMFFMLQFTGLWVWG